MSKITVLGQELEFDFFDADELERYEGENLKVEEDFNKLDYKSMSNADALRAQCRIINVFFDNLFGEGTAEKLFHGKSNIKDHLNAFAAITNAAVTSDQEIGALRGRYSPERAGRYEGQQPQRSGAGNVTQFKGNPKRYPKHR